MQQFFCVKMNYISLKIKSLSRVYKKQRINLYNNFGSSFNI